LPLDEGTPLRLVSEWEIDPLLAHKAQTLLGACFPGYPPRSYFKLPPQQRYFVFGRDELVAQAGVTHRVIRVGDLVAKTIGVVDLCVRHDHRSRGIATALLEEITSYARECGVDFVVLFADRHDLYLRAGWALVANRCSWLKIDDHHSLGLAEGDSRAACLMVKPIGYLAWPPGEVDMLGHVF
jgi:GNAT superfamily N-acetyltransferase